MASVSGLLGTMPAAAEAIKPVSLKTPVAVFSHVPGAGVTIRWIADRVDTVSNGGIKMRLYEPNTLIAPLEILDAVSSGKVNAGYASAGLWAGKMPASRLFSAVPFGPEAGEYLAWLWYGHGMTLYQEMYDRAGYDVKVLVCGILPPRSSGWFESDVNNAADLRELKMRFFGLGAHVMRKLGVSVTPIAAADTLVAKEHNAIEAAEFSTPAVERANGLQLHFKYNYFPGWHQQASIQELLINKKQWDKLHASQQMVLDVICRAATAESFAAGEATQFGAMRDNVEKNGVKIRYWSNEMLNLFEKTWLEVAKEQAAADPFFAKVWNDLVEFRAGYEVWKRNAFLPRAERR